jgi:hypothetical protein
MLKKRLKKPEEIIKRYNKVVIKSIADLVLYYDECEEKPELENKEIYYHPQFFRSKDPAHPEKNWYTFLKSFDDEGKDEICEKADES